MRLSYFVLILAKRVLATCLCCAFCTSAFAAEDGEPGFSASNFHVMDEMDKTSDLALFALGLAGTQYKFGGNSPDAGMDCSGLVRYVFKEILDKDLPRSSEEISHVGNAIEDHELRPGDLVFFNTLKRAFSHVGIYLGENKFIHSPASGGKVRIESMSVHYWKQRFNGARRIIGWRDAPR
ncbi:C40 family peptidase [Keguizhuia sedimenti]|uniref:C40 family peptidase n=1 Tax=Keguizhuia sedimenti TaxID=3064264 RepID=UPI003BAE8051